MRFAADLISGVVFALSVGTAMGSDLPERAAASPLTLAQDDTGAPADIRPPLAKPKVKAKIVAALVFARPAKRTRPAAAEFVQAGPPRVFAAGRAAERAVQAALAEAAAEQPTPAAPPSEPMPKPAPAAEPRKSLAADYCAGIADAAQEARASWQVKKIAELEKALGEETRKLDEKKQEYQDWFQKQEALRRKAEDSVVAIFSRMRPDAAAAQLSIMEEASAAAMLAKMNARVASVILNEMTPAKAARLADAMSSQARGNETVAARGATP